MTTFITIPIDCPFTALFTVGTETNKKGACLFQEKTAPFFKAIVLNNT